MRSYSTPQSALDGEITKLAIVECIVSVALYVGAGFYLGTFRYLAIAIVLAPLTLFRTERSAEWGLELYKRWFKVIGRWSPPRRMLAIAVMTPVVGTMIRVVSTVYLSVRTPLQTLKDTPQNWLRQSFCTDFAHPPEIVPLEASADNDDVAQFLDFLEMLRQESMGWRIALTLAVSPLLVLGWLPSLIYRVSFKATALVYMPLIWVARATVGNTMSLKGRLERIKDGEIEKVRRYFSGVVLGTLATKLLLVYGLMEPGELAAKFPSQKFVTSFVVPDSWPWWQTTLGVDALVTFFLLFFADAALARIDDQRAWGDGVVVNTVSTVSFLRAALSVATIAGLFYLALGVAAPEFVSRITQ